MKSIFSHFLEEKIREINKQLAILKKFREIDLLFPQKYCWTSQETGCDQNEEIPVWENLDRPDHRRDDLLQDNPKKIASNH